MRLLRPVEDQLFEDHLCEEARARAERRRVSVAQGSDSLRARPSRRSIWISLLAVLFLAAATAVMRVRVTLGDPNFDARDSTGLLKSDPGLLVYLTQRVIEAHGHAPDDWRADPRIEHPSTYDVPARLPVAQEFVVAWLRLLFGDALPLHVFCLWVAGAFASLVVVGTWLLALELCGDAWLALLAALLASVLPATWRTMGFVLMDEDFSLPFLALHFGLVARALRVRTPSSILLASLALGCAVATWHATSFLITIEALCVLAMCLRTGDNPMRARGAWIVPVVMLAFGIAVPFLRTSGFVRSGPMVVVLALGCAAIATRTADSITRRRAVLVGSLVALGAVAFLLQRLGTDDYGHVFGLIAAKIANMGMLPDDPNELSPDVRLMWQGPFATLDAHSAWTMLGLSLCVVPFAVREGWLGLRRGTNDPLLCATALLACAAGIGAWLVARVVVLPAIVLPALAAGIAVRGMGSWPGVGSLRGMGLVRAVLGLLVLIQGALFTSWITSYSNPWYATPRQRQAEIASMVRAVERIVPRDATVACDSINATAILAQTGRSVILSPKWESQSSRARVVEFTLAFYRDTPEQFHALLTDEFRCEWLLVDRLTLGSISRYAAGLAARDPGPPPGTAAATFLSLDESRLKGVPGYELVYRSPRGILQSNGAPTDFFRLYRLTSRGSGH